jgi:hypothetical protein
MTHHGLHRLAVDKGPGSFRKSLRKKDKNEILIIKPHSTNTQSRAGIDRFISEAFGFQLSGGKPEI